MRIASGDTARQVAFVAVDATDFATRETGLSSFTVYRCRDGGTPAAMTTPTIAELDATNLPGVYTLLVDEDTTIGAGNDEEELVLHITATGMAPVTLTVELFRPKYTEGSTLDAATINAQCDTAISDASLATSAAVAALNDLDAAGVRAAVGLASANLDTQLGTIDTEVGAIQTDLSNGTDGLGAIKTSVDAIPTSNPSAASIADAVWTEAIADHSATVGSTAEALDNAGAAGTPPTAAAIADAVWDEPIAGHLTAGSTGASLNAAGGSGDPWITTLPGSYTGAQAGKILADILTDTGTTIPATLTTIEGKVDAVDTVVDAVLVDTGTTIPGLVAALNDLDAAGIRTAVGLASANLDTQLAAVPTATENADALLNRDMSAVSDTNARTPLNALRFLRNRWSVAGTTLTVTKEDDTASAWTATLTSDGSANPVVGSDPA